MSETKAESEHQLDDADAAASPDQPIPIERGVVSPVGKSLFRRHRLKLLLSLVLGGGLAYMLAQGGLPLVPPRAAFAGAHLWTIPVYLLIMGIIHFLRAVRWRHLLEPLDRVAVRDVISVSWISFAIILLSPLRSGEVARPYLITKRSQIRWWEATGTIGAERVIDGLILSLLLFVFLQTTPRLDPLPDRVADLPVPVAAVPGAATTAVFLFVGAAITMAIFYFWRDFARRATRFVFGPISERFATLLADTVGRVANGLSFLPNARHFAPFLGETLAYWVLNALGAWLLAWGSGLTDMGVGHAFVAMGCIGIGILVPSGPGYFGAFQLSAFAALALYFPENLLKGPGAVFVFLLYVCQVGWHLLGAVIGLLLVPPKGGSTEANLAGARKGP